MQIEGLVPITRIDVDLSDDGRPPLAHEFTDGRGVWDLAFVPNVLGRFVVRLHVRDINGCTVDVEADSIEVVP